MITTLKKPRNVLHLRPKIRPQYQRQKNGMTTAIGFKCDDGIVLAADSEISEGWGKYEESKIIRLSADCFFAYAGRSLVVKDKNAEFQRASETTDPIARENDFRTLYRLIWQEARQKEAEGESEPYTDFLFVLNDNLFVAKGGDFAPVTFDVIGSGKDVARSTIDFFGVPMTCRQARLIATFALRQAKEFTAGTGKKTEIWEMAKGDALIKLYPFYIDYEQIEADFEFLKGNLRNVFLACPDSEIGTDDFSRIVESTSKRMKEYHRVKVRDREKQRKADAALYDKLQREEGL